MAVAALISLEEYLGQTYHPDCDYLEGVLEARNMGEIGHGDAQGRVNAYVLYSLPKFWSATEVRVQVSPSRFRVPDVIIVAGARPSGRYITAPPLVAVEVLSPEDRASALQSRIDDYLHFGVSAVWVLDPDSHRGFIHTLDGSYEPKDRILRTPAHQDLAVPLAAIFPA
jgi:Uma2 family endonuclease